MSILLIGLDEDRGPALVTKLVGEGDIVGVIDPQDDRGDRWRQLGAHVAKGQADDADLIERAAQHARSIVILESSQTEPAPIVEAVVQGARLLPGEAPRVIYVGDNGAVVETLGATGMDYVILRAGNRRTLWPRASAPSAADLAEAVNAADDLAGAPRLELDLTTADAWATLGVQRG